MKSLLVTSTVRNQLEWEPQVVVASYNMLQNYCKEDLFASMSTEEKEKVGLEVASSEAIATLVYKKDALVGWALKAGNKVVASKVLSSEKASISEILKNAVKNT